MHWKPIFLYLLLYLLTTRCAVPLAASNQPAAAATLESGSEGALPASFAATQPAPGSAPALTADTINERSQPRAVRYTGRLWTLCDLEHPELGFCLTHGQAREIWLRFGEDVGRLHRLAIDAVEAQDKALASASTEYEGKMRAILAGVLGGLAAFVAGGVAGILIGHFYIH